MARADQLLASYRRHVSLTPRAQLPLSQRVWLIVYPPDDERRMVIRICPRHRGGARAGVPRPCAAQPVRHQSGTGHPAGVVGCLAGGAGMGRGTIRDYGPLQERFAAVIRGSLRPYGERG